MFDKADLTSAGVTIPDPIETAERDEADLAAQLADLKAGRGEAFFYPNGAFDWEPLFRFSHVANLFVYADSRFAEKRFDQAFEAIRTHQTKVGDGLVSLQMGDPSYTDTLEREILPVAMQEALNWVWAGTQPVEPWATAKLVGRRIGQLKRRLWLIYIGGSPLAAYRQLFAERGSAPRCLCLRELVDVDTPPEAEATFAERSAAWEGAARWRGPLRQIIRRRRAPLPEFLVGDCDQFDWPHSHIRQSIANWPVDFGATVCQLPGAHWPDLQPANEQGVRRVVVTLTPLNPRTAKRVDAIVVTPSFYRKYQWPEHLTVILERPPQGADEVVPNNASILVREIAERPLAEGLQIVQQVAAERNLSRVAMERFGFEDEGEYLREWRQTDGAIKELTIHAIDDGTFLDFAPYADQCD